MAVETRMEGFQSGNALIVIVLDCWVGLCVVGELAWKAEGLPLVDVRLNAMIANLRCSAMDKLAWIYMDSRCVCILFLSQRYLPWFLLPSIGGLCG